MIVSRPRRSVINQPTAEILVAAAAEDSLSGDDLRKIDAYWRACNYLCLGMLYLCENTLLREPLKAEHLKRRLIGHWGLTPARVSSGSILTG